MSGMWGSEVFFYAKDKANKGTDHLMVCEGGRHSVITAVYDPTNTRGGPAVVK